MLGAIPVATSKFEAVSGLSAVTCSDLHASSLQRLPNCLADAQAAHDRGLPGQFLGSKLFNIYSLPKARRVLLI